MNLILKVIRAKLQGMAPVHFGQRVADVVSILVEDARPWRAKCWAHQADIA